MEGDVGITGHHDPQGEAPWAVQLVVRLERDGRPSVTALYEASAMAVVALLADERSKDGGEWEPAVSRWLAGRIRKLARRARGAAWERAQALPGVTVAHAGAEVRALVPGPVDAVPPEISKLQLSGFDLDDPERRSAFDPPAGWPGVVIAVNPAIEASVGKMAAQAAHAGNIAWLEMPGPRQDAWREAGLPVVVVHPDASGWRAFVGEAPVLIRDAGLTELQPLSETTAARWAG